MMILFAILCNFLGREIVGASEEVLVVGGSGSGSGRGEIEVDSD